MPIINCRYCDKALVYGSVSDLPHFPFCSEKCKLLDLGAWLDGEHRIPSDETYLSDDLSGDDSGAQDAP